MYQHAYLHCGSDNLIIDHRTGDIVCADCGVVLQGHLIDEGAFWRNHEDSEDKSTAAGPISVRDQLLGEGELPTTAISAGGKLDNRKKQNAASLSQTQRRGSRSAKPNRIGKALEELSEIITRLGLPTSIEETAMVLFKKFVEKSPTRKKNLQPYVAASVYLACRQMAATRAVREIAAATNIDHKELGKKFKEMQRILEGDNMGAKVVTSEDFMSRYCQQLDLSHQTTLFCAHVVRKTMESGIAEGKSPISIAAAAIFMVTQYFEDQKRSEKRVMDVTQVSEPTLRAVYKLLREHKDQLLPPALLEPALLRLQQQQQQQQQIHQQQTPHSSPEISPYPSPRSSSSTSTAASPVTLLVPSSPITSSPPSSPTSRTSSSLSNGSFVAADSPQPTTTTTTIQQVIMAQPTASMIPTGANTTIYTSTLALPEEQQLLQQTYVPSQHDHLDYLLSTPPATPFLSHMAAVSDFIVDEPLSTISSVPSTIIYHPTLLETATYTLYPQQQQQHQ